MKYKTKPRSKIEQGFTIIELLIATSVFTLVLLGATFSIVEIGRIYIKGIIGSQTQSTARSIADQLSQAIQLTNPGTTTDVILPTQVGVNQYAFCINGQYYTYILGQEQTTTNASFVEVSTDGCSEETVQSLPSGWQSGSELLSPNMRLTSFSMTQPYNNDQSLYSIDFTVAYGDNDVFINQNTSDGCLTFNSGGAFCDLVPFTTTVQDRL